jgi:sulfate transport system ATP-binding protein
MQLITTATPSSAAAIDARVRVWAAHEGRVEQVGSPAEIYDEPATAFVAGFVGAANVLQGHVSGGHVQFGENRLPGAEHLEEGTAARAYVRPHDVRITSSDSSSDSVVAIVERMNRLGWLTRMTLRLPDGQSIIAQVPSEEAKGVQPGDSVSVDLRNAKAFESPAPVTPATTGR